MLEYFGNVEIELFCLNLFYLFVQFLLNIRFIIEVILKNFIMKSHRMSMFFFRLHNLQREEANKKKKKAELRQRRGAKVFRRVSNSALSSHLTLAPSRLFEKTPMSPSDSLDEIALQIPRYLQHQTSVECDLLKSLICKLLISNMML